MKQYNITLVRCGIEYHLYIPYFALKSVLKNINDELSNKNSEWFGSAVYIYDENEVDLSESQFIEELISEVEMSKVRSKIGQRKHYLNQKGDKK